MTLFDPQRELILDDNIARSSHGYPKQRQNQPAAHAGREHFDSTIVSKERLVKIDYYGLPLTAYTH